ncbi:hypothetical protein F5050DRAFT_613430 [Lentinula boryana]|uniref:RING-type domain-containing protein n=1 Tax=Lentinula boryana TaxID=40481 RepID=A0ABQ8Q5Z3_9AGAR|nr:hypothetical protein F5050DRAFT_613430 [Lentinula boryana]
MSAESTRSTHFDFWEFVSCAKCQLPFNGNGSTVPFWLTECGHVVCNNHLSPDQTCPQCKSSGIQLVPLQHDMEPPMSEWFRSVPYVLDSAAYAVKFQQESMASQIRNLKARHQQQRAYIDRLKKENAQLKQTNEMLTMQVTGMYDTPHDRDEPATFVNSNGKRQMIEVSHPPSSSSPRSIVTPVGPNRITLPPGQQPPQLSSNQAISSDITTQRPGTNRYTQQFAYTPIQGAQACPAQLSHTQAAPKQLRQALQADNQISSASRSQIHPLPAAKHEFLPYSNSKSLQASHSNMGPPRYPRNVSTNVQPSSTHQPPNPTRFLPLNERFPPPPGTAITAATSRRFVPPASARSNFRPSTSSLLNTASNSLSRGQPNVSRSGQRMPFVPGQ